MSFDPFEEQGVRPEMTVAQLELRSVVCLPLIRLRSGAPDDTRAINAMEDTVGLIYMDSRATPADLSSGNRELLQTLAIEASTILENARLIEEERGKLRMEDELQTGARNSAGTAAVVHAANRMVPRGRFQFAFDAGGRRLFRCPPELARLPGPR